MNDEISPLSEADSVWLKRAESHILQMLRQRYGDVAFDHSESDLDLAQRPIDERVFAAADILELQCLGVVLGNVFAANTEMQWARVKNEYGDMLANYSERIRFTLYPYNDDLQAS